MCTVSQNGQELYESDTWIMSKNQVEILNRNMNFDGIWYHLLRIYLLLFSGVMAWPISSADYSRII